MTAKTFISLFTSILLLLSSPAWGQDGDYPKTEFFGGFSYLNADLNTDLGSRQNLFGWQVSISDNFHKNVGLVVEVAGAVSGKFTMFARFLGGRFIQNIRFHDILLGPRFMVRGERVTWFANAMAGIRFAKPLISNVPVPLINALGHPIIDPATGLPVVLNSVTPDEFLALGFGGGMDVSVNDLIGIRVFQLDYRPNRARGLWSHDVRFSSGIVLKWNY